MKRLEVNMKRMKLRDHLNRMVSLLFLLLMFVNIIIRPVPVSADTYSGTCGKNLTWSLDTSTGVLEISGVGNTSDYYSFSPAPWYSYRDTILQVIINSGVTGIGSSAFAQCGSLGSISIPEGVTSIGRYTFDYCTSLTSVTFPEGVTGIDEYVFRHCSSLTSVTIPESVTRIRNSTFYGCTSLTSITIPESVTNIGEKVFYGCTSLTSITIPESVTNIGDGAFHGCSSLTSITIPGSVKSISYRTFCSCSSLKNITIPEGVTSIGDEAFDDCTSLTSITIPESVTGIGELAFSRCSSMTNITIPESVTRISARAFFGCSSLTNVTIPEGVTLIDYAVFYHCTSLTSITIPESVTSIGESAFSGCSSLTSITIPKAVTDIGKYAFHGCSSLTGITIPKGVMSIGDNAFSYCSSLTSITIPEGVTSIGVWAFSYCSSLTSITIPGSVTSIGDGTCVNCVSLTSITIPEGVTIIGGLAFYGCSSLTSISIPESVTSVGARAFERCSALSNITIPEGVTSIGSRAFLDSTSLTSVTIAASVTSIGEYAFSGCSSLKSVYFGGSLPTIGYMAYFGNAPGRGLYYNTYYQDSWSPNGETSQYGYPIAPMPLITGFSLDSPIQLGVGIQKNITINTVPEHASHNPFTYLSQDLSIASVSNDGIITGQMLGTTIIAVTEPALKLTKLLMVQVYDPVSSLTISGEQTPIDCGDTFQLTVDVSPSSAHQSVKWMSTNPNVAGVEQTGLVTGTGGGSTYIIAKAVDGSNISDSFLLEVIRHPESIALDEADVDVYTANPVQLTATVLPADTSNKNLLWSSSDESVAVVEHGLVTAIDNGSALITATTEDGNISASCQVHCFVSVEEVTLDKSNLILAIDETEILVATVLPENAGNKNLEWTSTDHEVATVENGEVTGQGEGMAAIIVASEDGGISAMCVVTVYPEATYQVTFESNGGSGVSFIVADYGSTIAPPEEPVKTDYTFRGWYKDSALTQKWDFETDLILKATTLYARWTLNQYEVTFEVEGGSDVPTQIVDHGGLVIEPTDPTKYDYLFRGWYVDEGLTEAFDFATPVTGPLTLYARWVTGHTLTYLAGENGHIKGNLVQKVEDGHDGTEVEAIPDPGYHFDRWSDGITTASRTDTNVQDDLTVQALFVKKSDPVPDFPDVPSNKWYYPYVMFMANRGIVSGWGTTGQFRPNNNVIREHVAKMICLSADLPLGGTDTSFEDHAAINPSMIPYIRALMTTGAIGGFPGNTFQPKDNIKRSHACKMVAQAFDLQAGDLVVHLNDLPASQGLRDAILTLASNGIVSGYGTTGEFRPNNEISRAELSKMLCVTMAVSAVQRAEREGTWEAIWAAQAILDALPYGHIPETIDGLQARLDAIA